MAESTSLKNKIHAELARRGTRTLAEMRTPFTKNHVAWLRLLNIIVINDRLDLLEVVQRKIDDVNDMIEAAAMNDEDVRLLETIPGVGHVIAVPVKAETGGLGRFDSSGGLVCYAGLHPRTWQSGEKGPVLEEYPSMGTPALGTCSLRQCTCMLCAAMIPS